MLAPPAASTSGRPACALAPGRRAAAPLVRPLRPPRRAAAVAAASASSAAAASAAPPPQAQWDDVVEFRLPDPPPAAMRGGDAGVGRVLQARRTRFAAAVRRPPSRRLPTDA